jgi:hypothetical protein
MFVRTTDKGAMFLTAPERTDAGAHLDAFFAAYSWLACAAVARGARLWKLRPKFHGLMHIRLNLQESALNPRHVACWKDEEYVGRICKTARRGHANAVAMSTLHRYFMLLALQWGTQPARA